MTLTATDEPTPTAERLCSVTFLHGVGLDPTLVADVVDELRAREPGIVVHVPLRRGYRSAASGEAASTFDELVADVTELVAAAAPTVLVGVSGGATLAVAAAIRSMPGVASVIAHEPLVGVAAADLHAAVQASAATLADDDSPDDVTTRACAFVARLVGPDVWASLPHGAHAFTATHAAAVHAEVPLFVGFAPTTDELASVRRPVVVSTGALSGPARHAAAAVLGAAGACVRVIEGAGHLAVWQRPTAFADLVHEAWLAARRATHDTEDAA